MLALAICITYVHILCTIRPLVCLQCVCVLWCFYKMATIFLQSLGGELRGECRDFEAVPGHGLKCSVWGVESQSNTSMDNNELIKRHIVIQTTSSLLPQQSSGASLPRNYQVLSVHLQDSEVYDLCEFCYYSQSQQKPKAIIIIFWKWAIWERITCSKTQKDFSRATEWILLFRISVILTRVIGSQEKTAIKAIALCFVKIDRISSILKRKSKHIAWKTFSRATE